MKTWESDLEYALKNKTTIASSTLQSQQKVHVNRQKIRVEENLRQAHLAITSMQNNLYLNEH